MLRATVFGLVLSGYLIAGDVRVTDSHVTGDTVTVVTAGEFRIGEHDTPADMRKQSLDEAKIYAAEFIGTYVKNERHLEQVGDAALSRTKSLITTYSAGRMPSEVLSENSDGTIYKQTAKHTVSIQSFLEEIDRQKKIADIEKSISAGPSIEAKNDFAAAVDKINRQKSLLDERKKYLTKFTTAALDSKFLQCTTGSIDELKDGTAIAKYDCLFSPPLDYIENYKLYYQTDICNAHATKIDLPSPDSKKTIGQRTSEIASYGFLGLGSILIAPIWLEINALDHTVKYFNREEKSEYNAITINDVRTEYDDNIQCSPNFVEKDPETEIHVMAFGGLSAGSFQAIDGGKIIKSARFTITHKLPAVSKVKDLRENLGFKLDSKEIEFSKNYAIGG